MAYHKDAQTNVPDFSYRCSGSPLPMRIMQRLHVHQKKQKEIEAHT